MNKALEHLKSTQKQDANSQGRPLKPSAERVAQFRALHQMLDRPLIHDDPLAAQILGPDWESAIRGDLTKFNTPLFKGLRASVVARSRLSEDLWDEAKRSGVTQYVILGAGLDTFAYRTSESVESRIFEVDLPDMQHWKRRRLRKARVPEPDFVSYVPCDFERTPLAVALNKAGFCADKPAFFSWLGVTMYLREETILSTLRFVASLKPNSTIVFDFIVTPAILSDRERMASEMLFARASEGEEPWETVFDPGELKRLLHSLGYGHVELYLAQRVNDLYFSGREDGLRKSGVSAIISARV